MAPGKIRVLVCDDSLVAREMIGQILGTDPSIEVVGMAKDGFEAVEMVERLAPDLVTMDIHMPRMGGLEATERIMAFHPTPILVVSSSVHAQDTGVAFDALSAGALEVLKKPEPADWADLERIGREVIRKVRILSKVKVITHLRGKRPRAETEAPIQPPQPMSPGGYAIVAVGSSTGGPSALHTVFAQLPRDFPLPVVVAQHIADGFIPGLVEWLDSSCAVRVRAARDGELAQPGVVHLAPTGRNLALEGGEMRFRDPEPGQLYIPSADTLFASVAKAFGPRSIGVILTGMGADGAEGLKRMRDTGAVTIAQDETTSTVYGMPRVAAELGAAAHVLAVGDIGEALVRLAGGAAVTA